MARRRKLRTEVVRTATLEFPYDPIMEAVPSEQYLREAIASALRGYKDINDVELVPGGIAMKTTLRKVPDDSVPLDEAMAKARKGIEEPQSQ